MAYISNFVSEVVFKSKFRKTCASRRACSPTMGSYILWLTVFSLAQILAFYVVQVKSLNISQVTPRSLEICHNFTSYVQNFVPHGTNITGNFSASTSDDILHNVKYVRGDIFIFSLHVPYNFTVEQFKLAWFNCLIQRKRLMGYSSLLKRLPRVDKVYNQMPTFFDTLVTFVCYFLCFLCGFIGAISSIIYIEKKFTRETFSYQDSWYWDQPVTHVNQNGERVYWIVRHYSDGPKIRSKKCQHLQDCYMDLNSNPKFERQTTSYFNLSDAKIAVLPILSHTYFWQCVSCIILLMEFRRIKADARTYGTFFCAQLAQIAGPKIMSGEFRPQIAYLLEFLVGKAEIPDGDVMMELLDCNRVRSIVPPLRPLDVDKILAREHVQFQTRQTHDAHFSNILIVGSCIFAMLSAPSWTSLQVLQDHVYNCVNRNKTIFQLNSLLDVCWSFASACYSLITTIAFAVRIGDFSIFLGGARKLRERFKALTITQQSLASLMVEESTLLPHANISQYEIEIHNLMSDITHQKSLPPDEMKSMLDTLKAFQLELNKGQFANLPRKSPYTVCVIGRSAIGKSSIVDMLFTLCAKAYGLPEGDHSKAFVYVHNSTTKHFDACESWHWGYLFDDIARERASMVTGDHNSANALLDVVGNTTFKPPQAAVDKKGEVICRPRICVLTTNNKSLNAHVFAACPAAIQRRVHMYITPEPLDSLKGADGMIDSDKFRNHIDEHGFGAQWTYTVEHAELSHNPGDPILGDKVNYRTALHNASWEQFSDYYLAQLDRHDDLQRSVVSNMYNLTKSIKFCAQCRKVICKCPPVEISSNESDEELLDRLIPNQVSGYSVEERDSRVDGVLNRDPIGNSKSQGHEMRVLRQARTYGGFVNLAYRRAAGITSHTYDWIKSYFEYGIALIYSSSSIKRDWRWELLIQCEIDGAFLYRWRKLTDLQFMKACSDHLGRQLVFRDGVRIGMYPSNLALSVDMDFDYSLILRSEGLTYWAPTINHCLVVLFVLYLVYTQPQSIANGLLVTLGALLVVYKDTIPYYIRIHRYLFGARSSWQFVQRNYLYFIIGSLLAAISFLAIFPLSHKVTLQGNTLTASNCMLPSDEKPDWWSYNKCPNNWLRSAELTQHIKTAKAGTKNFTDFTLKCLKNSLFVQYFSTNDFSPEKAVSGSYAFALDNNWIAVNDHGLHGLHDRNFMKVFRYNRTMSVANGAQHDVIKPDNILQSYQLIEVIDLRSAVRLKCHEDLTLIYSSKNLGVKDVSGHLIGEDHTIGGKVRFMNNQKIFAPTQIGLYTCDLKNGCKVSSYKPGTTAYWITADAMGTIEGDCGTPYVGQDEAIIYGIHGGKISTEGFAVPIYKEYLDRARALLIGGCPAQLSERQVQCYPDEVDLSNHFHHRGKVFADSISKPHPKAHAIWLENHCGEPVANVQLYNKQHTTEMKWMFTKPFWDKKGIHCDKFIPDLAAWYKESYAIGIREINMTPLCVPTGIFNLCADHYFTSVLNRLPSNWKENLGVLPFGAVCHGLDNEQYIDHLNYHTSAGFPWYTTKANLGMSKNEHPGWLEERVETLDSVYKSGKRAHPVFCSHLKDEFVSLKKKNAHQLRVFVGSPLDFTIVIRKYFLSMVQLIQKLRILFESSVSIACQGLDWTELVEYMWGEGFNRDIDGDYRAYDKGMHQYCTRLASRVIYRFCEESGKYTSEDLRAMVLILEDICDPLVEYDGTLVFFSCSNPSGHPLTVHFNCIVNCIYIRYCYFKKLGNLHTFEDSIRCTTYGDDNWITVRDGVDFTHHDMQVILSEIGITYTNAQKDDKIVYHTPRDKVTFLKRSPRLDDMLTDVYGRYIYTAPLELASIHKMLHGSKSTNVALEAVKEGFSAALNEICLHGRDAYDELLDLILECCVEYGLTQFEFNNYYKQISIYFEKVKDLSGSYLAECKTVRVPGNLIEAGNGLGFARQSCDSSWVLIAVEPPSNFMNDSGTTDEREYSQTIPNVNRTGDSIGDIGSFFSRDVKITTITISEGTNYTGMIYPWDLYFSNSIVRNKIKNFSKVRGNLHLTFLMNANPFRYGQLLCCYKPLVSPLYTNTTAAFGKETRDQSGGNIDDYSYQVMSADALTCISARPHVQLFARKTTKAEMVLPFVHFNEYLPMTEPLTTTSAVMKAMGKIDIVTLVSLATAAAASGNPMTIDIFARLEDWDICGPSIQSQVDEYDTDKPISSIASAVAQAAHCLSKLPVIGPFAMATSVVSSAIGSVARWFGFSNPVLICDTNPVKMVKSTRWADTEARLPMAKLALDPKNELTIDPRVNGYPPDDQMLIESITARPGYIGSTAWQCSDGVDFLLQCGAVTPAYFNKTTFTNYAGEVVGATARCLGMTPATHIAQAFTHWAGDMRIKFQVVCSAYHRGRLRFIYDPAGEFTNFEEGAVFSRIIDLNDEDEFEVVIPWQGYRSKLNVWQLQSGSTTDQTFASRGNLTSIASQMQSYANGYWRVQVMTELSAPLDANAYISTWVSFENMRFSKPTYPGEMATVSYIAPITVQRQSVEYVPGAGVHDQVDKIIDGESVHSLRQLVHRWGLAFIRSSGTNTITVGANQNCNAYLEHTFKRFPLYYGPALCYNVASPNAAISKFSNGGRTFMNYFTPCFTLRRGAINWRLNIETRNPTTNSAGSGFWGGALSLFSAMLSQADTVSTASKDTVPTLTTGSITAVRDYLTNAYGNALYKGGELVSDKIQQLEASCPEYGATKGQGCNPSLVNASLYNDTTTLLFDTNIQGDCLTVAGDVGFDPLATINTGGSILTTATIQGYACAGVDFNLLGYLNPPTVYYLTALP